MPLTAPKTENKDFDPMPAGAHLAVCNMVIDLGVQAGEYMGKPKNTHEIYIRWEAPNLRFEWEDNGEKKEGPRVIGRTYTLSLGEKAHLTAALEGWRGRTFTDEEKETFDIFSILGKPCLITVIHEIGKKNGKTYSKVKSVSPVPDGMTAKAAELPLLRYSTAPDAAAADTADFDKLRPWQQEKINNQVAPDYSPHDNLGSDDIGPPIDHNPDATAIAEIDVGQPQGDIVDENTGEVMLEDDIPF